MPTRPATPSAVQPARLFDSRGDLDHPFEETIEPATLARPPSDSGARCCVAAATVSPP